MSIDLESYIPFLSIVISTMGVSFVFKDFIGDLLATMVIKKTGDIKVGKRIKIMLPGNITKGDIMEISLMRTTVMEVGDGERLPSVRTGRLIKVPNYMLMSNPVMVYGDTIIDEVVAYVPRPYPDSQLLLDSMKEAIINNGNGLIEVGLYQKENNLVIHGVFEVKTSEMVDERSKILRDFLTMTNQASSGIQETRHAVSSEENKMTIPLQNIE